MAILLTGGSGFLGSKLAARLVERGIETIVLARKESRLDRLAPIRTAVTIVVADAQPLARVLEPHRIELIVHCATNYGRPPSTLTDVVRANVVLPLDLLEFARQHGVGAFVNTDTVLERAVNGYALSKWQFREWFRLFEGTMVCVNVALEHFYGPQDDPSKFVTRIIRELLQRVDRIPLTAGRQQRDFIFIDDAVDALMRVIDFARTAPRGPHRFEVGSTQTVEIRRLVELVASVIGNDRTRLEFGAVPYREHETMQSSSDSSSMAALGWAPRTPLEQGLTITIDAEKRRLGL